MHHQEFQHELAKTYFKEPEKKKDKPKTEKWKPALPWIIAAACFIIALLAVLFKSSIDIKVRVFGEVPAIGSASVGSGIVEGADRGIFLINGGEPNKDIIKDVYFAGDGKPFSSVKKDELVLCNSRGWGWANYTIELKDAIDLNKLDIKYTARGLVEDEYLALVIVDSNNRLYRLEKDLSSELTKEWQRYTINFKHVGKVIDLSNITKIKFEFGSLTAGNHPNAVILLKDIYITKTRRLKWL